MVTGPTYSTGQIQTLVEVMLLERGLVQEVSGWHFGQANSHPVVFSFVFVSLGDFLDNTLK
jgi:hypothetical protein